MGGTLSLFSKLLWSAKEIRILILGLDNAGKTTLLYRLKIGEVVTTIPTIGFNVESVTYKSLNFNVWDLGGQTSIRPYWRCYYANTAAVVFVIDSTDVERLETAAGELRAMLGEEELRDASLLVFANKQDQPGARGAGEISEALRLGELKDRNWSIMACSAIAGTGVNEGMDWLVVSTNEKVTRAIKRDIVTDSPYSKQWERIRRGLLDGRYDFAASHGVWRCEHSIGGEHSNDSCERCTTRHGVNHGVRPTTKASTSARTHYPARSVMIFCEHFLYTLTTGESIFDAMRLTAACAFSMDKTSI